jgi:hypothetical protein
MYFLQEIKEVDVSRIDKAVLKIQHRILIDITINILTLIVSEMRALSNLIAFQYYLNMILGYQNACIR